MWDSKSAEFHSECGFSVLCFCEECLFGFCFDTLESIDVVSEPSRDAVFGNSGMFKVLVVGYLPAEVLCGFAGGLGLVRLWKMQRCGILR